MRKVLMSPIMRHGHPEDAMPANQYIVQEVERCKGLGYIEIKRYRKTDNSIVNQGKRTIVVMEKINE